MEQDAGAKLRTLLQQLRDEAAKLPPEERMPIVELIAQIEERISRLEARDADKR